MQKCTYNTRRKHDVVAGRGEVLLKNKQECRVAYLNATENSEWELTIGQVEGVWVLSWLKHIETLQ
jgi:hypothetical protein